MSSGPEQADSVIGGPPRPASASGGRHAASASGATASGSSPPAYQDDGSFIKNQFFVTLPNYSFRIDITSWGWIHLAVGALVFIAGICLILGQLWARIVGVVLALISAVAPAQAGPGCWRLS